MSGGVSRKLSLVKTGTKVASLKSSSSKASHQTDHMTLVDIDTDLRRPGQNGAITETNKRASKVSPLKENSNELRKPQRLSRRPSTRLSLCLEGSGEHNIALSWKDVNVKVKIPGKKAYFRGESVPPQEKLILKNITGIAPSGCLLAIMGASGSGKSTLLNVLTMRNTKDYVTKGEVYLNGVPITDGMRNVSAYVQQSDLFIHTLTVREQLQFRALLRMDKTLGKKARLARVEEVMQEMGLTGCADSRIGAASGSRKGISGGERKRLSFASEALTNPPIFFCDEPTSSLDTFMAQSIVHTLQKMASKGRAVLCTIHQPSSELFALFNQVLLLSEGRVAFMGSSQDAIDFFTRLNYPCPRNFNPADHYILTLAIVPGKEEECRKNTNAICDSFLESTQASHIDSEIDIRIRESELADAVLLQEITGESRYTSSYFVQLTNLFWRSWTSQFRDHMLFWVRIVQSVAIALVLGLVYLQLEVDQKGVQNINGGVFLLIVNISFTNLFAVLTSFPEEMGIVMRELGTGLYRIDIYYITKAFSELPLFAAVTVMFATVTYWMMGLKETTDGFMICCGVLILVAITSVGLGYVISVIAGDTTIALSIASPVLVPFLLFGGLFLNADDTPVYFIWLEKMSWFKYANEIMLVSQWESKSHIACENRNATIFPNMTMEEICRVRACQFNTGAEVLAYNSMDPHDVDLNYGCLCAIMIGFYIVGFIALAIRARRSQE
ncbi:protein white [Aplysia californica]|uniref:Protein white n=1 Tax=Aplysia californica TaxID=6500 RepID=A0ABM0ZW08_APLCA|nr:protein white [Aplysia californica]